MTIIQDFLKLINSNLKRDFLVYISLIFCIFVGFALGRISKISEIKPNLNFLSIDGTIVADLASTSERGQFSTATSVYNSGVSSTHDKSIIFASSKGKYFYYKGCGGNTISPKNLIYYKSEAQALASGKTLYSKCK